jgi:hypothetical protein
MRGYFVYTLSFFLLISLGVSLVAGNMPTEEKVAQIDRQISELQDLKRGYESRALRHEDAAQYQQFESRNYLETRRHIELAQENRAKAEAVQKKIDQLEIKRADLLKEEAS